MSAALYIFRLVWPFLKEFLLGGLTLREGMRTQKKKVFLLFFVSGLILSLFVIIPKFYHLSQEHIKLEKSVDVAKLERLEKKVKELETKLAHQNTEQKPIAGPAKTEPPKEPVAKTEPIAVPSVPKKPKPKKQEVIKQDIVPRHPDAEVKYDRKKAYMDFFDKIDK